MRVLDFDALAEGNPSSLTGNTDPTSFATAKGAPRRPSVGSTSASDRDGRIGTAP